MRVLRAERAGGGGRLGLANFEIRMVWVGRGRRGFGEYTAVGFSRDPLGNKVLLVESTLPKRAEICVGEALGGSVFRQACSCAVLVCM